MLTFWIASWEDSLYICGFLQTIHLSLLVSRSAVRTHVPIHLQFKIQDHFSRHNYLLFTAVSVGVSSLWLMCVGLYLKNRTSLWSSLCLCLAETQRLVKPVELSMLRQVCWWLWSSPTQSIHISHKAFNTFTLSICLSVVQCWFNPVQ